jgi:hypothetical protein
MVASNSNFKFNAGSGVQFTASAWQSSPSGSVQGSNLFGNSDAAIAGLGATTLGFERNIAGCSVSDGTDDGSSASAYCLVQASVVTAVYSECTQCGLNGTTGSVRVYDAFHGSSVIAAAIPPGRNWVTVPATTGLTRPLDLKVFVNDSNPVGTSSITVSRYRGLGPGRYGIELSAASDRGGAGTVSARRNYWGTFPNVAEKIYEYMPNTIDFQEFRAAEIPGTGPRQAPGYDP